MLKPWVSINPEYPNLLVGSAGLRATALARTALLVTCRLRRQVVLEEWLNSLPGLPLGEWHHIFKDDPRFEEASKSY